MVYTRVPRKSVSRVTIGRREEFGYSAMDSTNMHHAWVIRCDAHIEDGFAATRAEAVKRQSQDFCSICSGHWDDYENEPIDTGEIEIVPPMAPDLSPKSASIHTTNQEIQ